MINLIPPQAKRSLRIEYRTRVISVWLLLWSVALIVGACILFPVYILIGSQIAVYEDSALEASRRVNDYGNVSTQLIQASQQAKYILDENDNPAFTYYTTLLESIEDSSINISSISFSRGEEEKISPIALIGVASDRQTLAAFRDRLVLLEDVSEVDLPISNLAQDKNIPFSITVVLNNDNEV